MKNYAIKSKDKPVMPYIIGFDYIDNGDETLDIQIYMTDGKNTIVPYNQVNLEKIRKIMTEQAKKATELLPSKKCAKTGFTIATVAGAVGVVLVNTTSFGKEINPILSNTTLGGITLLSAIGTIRNNRLIEDIRKLNLFVQKGAIINNTISSNYYIYANITQKDFEKISGWIKKKPEQPIQIEDLDEISFETLNTIWNNIIMGQKLELNYDSQKTYTKRKNN